MCTLREELGQLSKNGCCKTEYQISEGTERVHRKEH